MNTTFLRRVHILVLALTFSFALGLAPNAFAQDVECQCDDYVESYNQAVAEYNEALELTVDVTAEELIELQMNLDTKAEALAEAEANLEGCHERVLENKDYCSESPLTEEEQNFLLENSGRVTFAGYTTVEGLASAFFEDLIIHQDEVSIDLETGYDANAEMVMEYMMTEYGFESIMEFDFQGLIDAMNLAIKSFLESLGIGIFDGNTQDTQTPPCPDCSAIETELNAKNAAKTALETELQKAQQDEQDATNEYTQFMSDLADAINGVDDCETVDDYKDVQLGNQEAAGIMMGAHYHCKGETAIENFLKAIEDFRSTHRSETDILDDIVKAQAEVVRLIVDIAGLEVEISVLEVDLALCKDKRAELKCDNQASPDTTNQPSDTTGSDTTNGNKGRRRTLPSEPLEPTELGSDPAELDLTESTEAEVEMITATNQTAVETFAGAIRSKYDLRDELNFEDITGLDEETEAAIRALGRLRILLGQGSVSSDTAPRKADPNSSIKRGELAALFYRVGKVLDGYETSETGVQVFTDVNPSDWYGPAYEWMYVNGFYVQSRPGDTVNNAEFITALRRLLLMDPIVPDGATVWYDQEFETMATLLPEDYDGQPGDTPTRGFVIRMIYRALVQGGFDFN